MNGGAVRIKDVADLAGVSIGTVSNVVTGNRPVTPEYEKRVRKALDALGYVPNDTARHLRTGSSRTIGLVLTDLTNPYFVSLALGAEKAASEAGYGLLLGTSPEGSDREARYIDIFRRQRVDGVLVTPQGLSRTLVGQVRDSGSKIVMVDRKDPANGHCSVDADDHLGGLLAGRHLLAVGRRRLGFVGAPDKMIQMQSRLDGFREAATECAGASVEYLAVTDDLSIARGQAVGVELSSLSANRRPDGILTGNDLLALGMMQAMRSAGVRVPEDVAVIGYDDIPFAQTSAPQLTTVRSPSSLIGYTAVQLLVSELIDTTAHEHRHVTLPPELVVRESAGGARES